MESTVMFDIDSLSNWEDLAIPVTPTEALVLLFLEGNEDILVIAGPNPVSGPSDFGLTQFQKQTLRHIVYCNTHQESCASTDLTLSLDQLHYLEALFPMYGTIDEDLYGPLRIKISNAILVLEQVIFTNDGGDLNDSNEDPNENSCENPCEDSENRSLEEIGS